MRPIQDLYTHTLTLEWRDAASKYDSKVNKLCLEVLWLKHIIVRHCLGCVHGIYKPKLLFIGLHKLQEIDRICTQDANESTEVRHYLSLCRRFHLMKESLFLLFMDAADRSACVE